MADQDVALMAHLLRRAGFGASRDELEPKVAQGYETVVEELLNPESQPGVEEDLMLRYFPGYAEAAALEVIVQEWVYRMVNDPRQLQEKMALFWHMIFCAGNSKLDHAPEMVKMIRMFREEGMGNFRDLLLLLSTNPGMLYYLDNNESHREAVNENYGRELLELFSMGVGNYTEDDVKACTRAFTGWTIVNFIARYPWGAFPLEFEYRPEDHDDDEKEFLGHTGRFGGEDIIDIIVQQPATARFLAGKLYNFFVSDDPPTEEAIQTLSDAYSQSNYDIRSVMRILFNSEFFKQARFAKVKSPAELVAGVLRLVEDYREVKPGLMELAMEAKYIGQELLNPPTVEGWHTGKEWIDSGSLVGRVNFAADQVGDINHPGIRDIIERLAARGTSLSPEELVDGCLDLIGPLQVGEKTRNPLVAQASLGGEVRFGTPQEKEEMAQRVGEMLQLIVATREFQFA